MENNATSKAERKWLIAAIIISFLAVLLAILHVARPDWKIDNITLGLAIVAVLPWLAPLFKSVKLPGGWELVFNDLRREVVAAKGVAQEARGAAADAYQKAELATAAPASTTPPGANLGVTVEGMAIGSAGSAEDELANLAEQYNKIRDTQRSGPVRTSAMTAVVSQMIALAPALDEAVATAGLTDKVNRGKRLAAYAYLYARPDLKYLEPLVDSVIQIEDKPFGQYWGLQAIEKVIGDRKMRELKPQTVEKLNEFLFTLTPGTDRYFVLSRILKATKNEDRS